MVKRLAALVILIVFGLTMSASAQEPSGDTEQDEVEEAKRLFRQGVEMFSAGDHERALSLFSKSRQTYPSVQNTSNLAITLDELGRYDEALEMYELLLVEFKSELNDEDRKALGPAMAALRRNVGSLFVSANVDGKVVVDGRARGALPLTVPIRVLPGARQVRIMRNGYVTWEKNVKVDAGKTVRVDAKLERLSKVGLLRVVEASERAFEVLVDGAPMGKAPWEGTLGPGIHVVRTLEGDLGSAPKKVVVVEGQTAVIELESKPLGGELTVSAEPPSAAITIGDAALGKGRWSGRLPLGSYEVLVSEEGYHSRRQPVAVTAAPEKLELALEVDSDHPRWPQAAGGEGFIQAFGGFAFGPGFAAAAETNCQSCPDETTVVGLMVGARGGYRFSFGLGLELGGGYMRLGSSFDRVARLDDQAGVLYPIDDRLLLQGPFAEVSLSYRHMFIEWLGITARAGAGAFFEAATDDVEVRATKGGAQAALIVQDQEPVARAVSVFTQGDIALELVAGSFHFAVAMGIVGFVTDGATHEQRRTSLPLSCDPTNPGGIGCIRTGTPLPDESAHDIFFVGLPQLQVGYAF